MTTSDQVDPRIENEVNKQLEMLSYGCAEIVPLEEFKKMLRKSITQNTPLRVKCGIDPTSPDVHVGHLVPYKKMRQFQDLGHQGVVIIGDYTASVGDPTGKNEARKALDEITVKNNAQKYMEQLFTVLDKNKTEVRFQSEWFSKVTLRDILSWAGQTTVAKLLSHETFSERLAKGLPLGLHEIFYPVLQGIDSVYVKADIELGGTDQKFNVLMGRDFQGARNQREQVAILLPIITGTCGTTKMSKSLGNYIGILDDPFDKFGKVMSIPDSLMAEYYKYIIGLPKDKLEVIIQGLKDGTKHPNEVKKDLARQLVAFFHGDTIASEMKEKFENVFKRKEVPDDAPEMHFTRGTTLISVLSTSKMCESNAEIRRLIKQNAVSIVDGDKLTNPDLILDTSFAGKSLKIGKRKFLKLV
ncbi:MAG: tyrosine--tRNA ligase [Bdellovibrionales bacterium RIFOXYB1_FULL_37_110]|nr:MAG: tyrosine--tRNA ligase [Bdellovibrionales bacterium RIFOXYA1_FULL_38_20]OFZ51512.1 MAG: tyrosine--tRNA ligase [Bdellovibrionales bacterium RIFOXYC1_FULL_37_79]OFZ60346.1 MAG: tyrosine--tRNA ligase [Bdellovibrionales bacterium RIFOXYB1_FULL_37_110]OFZ63836.1 MAG: tyrosine--tRNA ligase [Bdellovibrionales bacterium RIFOXYD1_FULL_36_51]